MSIPSVYQRVLLTALVALLGIMLLLSIFSFFSARHSSGIDLHKRQLAPIIIIDEAPA